MNPITYSGLGIIAALALSGCSMTAPTYPISIDNVQALKAIDAKTTKVGTFSDSKSRDNANPISIRGSSMQSPYQKSYAKYLEHALREELSLANKLQASADTEISGEMLKNDLETGISEGHAHVEARFIVNKANHVVYDQVKSADHTWPSSFVGAVAIPKAAQEYPTVIQILLKNLYADPAFIKALN